MGEKRTVGMRGTQLELAGQEVAVGDRAPDFSALTVDLEPFRFSSTRGKIRVISSVPSLDTPVCDLQTKRFNAEAARLGERVRVLTISMDLPFAQKRWCAASSTDRVQVLSDHRDASFGAAFGILVPALRLLARAVFVIDADDVVRYVQLVPDMGQEPDYDAVIRAVQDLL
ncbi:MAG: thiol peroxidase [Deltaproteobacteria bacterium]|nr:thiol peroxidase [Deltaproteobacteria bacterium]